MFTKINIQHFRGIKQTQIEGFKQINLFFGKNNCGKSSLLECIFLASGLSNPLLPININIMRGYGKTRLEDLKLNFYNLDTSQPITIQLFDGQTRQLSISLTEQHKSDLTLNPRNPEMLSNVDDGKYGLKFDFQVDNISYITQIQFDESNPNNATRTTAENYTEALRCIYLSPKFDFNTSITGLNNILQNKDEHFIVEGLKVIEPQVQDFIFTDNEMLVDIGLSKRIPVNMMGDGARKIVALLTAMYDCKNGALLIDEISNGFHYSVMSNLWQVLIKAATRNNTQLFITTHDIDSIKGLRDAAINNSHDNIASFKLLRTKDDQLKAYHYTTSNLDYSLTQEIEVR